MCISYIFGIFYLFFSFKKVIMFVFFDSDFDSVEIFSVIKIFICNLERYFLFFKNLGEKENEY